MLNGDTWLDVNFAAMEAAAEVATAGVAAVLAVKRMRGFERYGTVDVDDSGTITAFHEKRPTEEGLINAGVYLLRKGVLGLMPTKFSLETGFFEQIVSDLRLKAVECHGGFIDIGVPGDYERAQDMLRPLACRWKLAMFDRDGTINVDIGHLHEPDKIQLIGRTVDVMRSFANDPSYKVVVMTNQAGIAKGLYSETDMRSTNAAMEEMLEERGARVDAWYWCPHHPDYTGACKCRKPAPGMLLQAMREFDAIPAECVMYGDKDKDREAAGAAGVRFEWAGEAVVG